MKYDISGNLHSDKTHYATARADFFAAGALVFFEAATFGFLGEAGFLGAAKAFGFLGEAGAAFTCDLGAAGFFCFGAGFALAGLAGAAGLTTFLDLGAEEALTGDLGLVVLTVFGFSEIKESNL